MTWRFWWTVAAALLFFAATFNPPVKFNVAAAGLFCLAVGQLR